MHAALVNFLNPNPYLAWSLVMGPLLLKGWRETPLNGIALLVGFYTTMIVGSMGIIVLFASAKRFDFRVTRILIGLSAIALGCFGAYQLLSGIKYYF
jgi:threonine/homoserine/homoserine lactone efflux protein